MKLEYLHQQQRELLDLRLNALARIRHGLSYTLGHLNIPFETTENIDDSTLEALAALNERFGKLQDFLAATMKQATLLAGEPSGTFVQVLSFMSKLGVVDDVDAWQNLRLLRNIGAHEYNTSPVHQAEYFSTLAAAVPMLEKIADRLVTFCKQELLT